MCITVLGRLLPASQQKMPVIYIVTARKNSALPLLTRVQKGLGVEGKPKTLHWLPKTILADLHFTHNTNT